MIIRFYNNASEPIRMDKVITQIGEYSGTLRKGSSIISPVIDVHVRSIESIGNYCFIPEFGNRYYFINDIQVIYNNYFRIFCHVDVLMSYRDFIRKQNAIIARQETLYNLYLDDDKFLTNAKRMYVTRAFPNRVLPGNEEGAVSHILTIAGGPKHT